MNQYPTYTGSTTVWWDESCLIADCLGSEDFQRLLERRWDLKRWINDEEPQSPIKCRMPCWDESQVLSSTGWFALGCHSGLMIERPRSDTTGCRTPCSVEMGSWWVLHRSLSTAACHEDTPLVRRGLFMLVFPKINLFRSSSSQSVMSLDFKPIETTYRWYLVGRNALRALLCAFLSKE